MNEFTDSTFTEIENRIHSAGLERSAALGEAIGGRCAKPGLLHGVCWVHLPVTPQN